MPLGTLVNDSLIFCLMASNERFGVGLCTGGYLESRVEAACVAFFGAGCDTTLGLEGGRGGLLPAECLSFFLGGGVFLGLSAVLGGSDLLLLLLPLPLLLLLLLLFLAAWVIKDCCTSFKSWISRLLLRLGMPAVTPRVGGGFAIACRSAAFAYTVVSGFAGGVGFAVDTWPLSPEIGLTDGFVGVDVGGKPGGILGWIFVAAGGTPICTFT